MKLDININTFLIIAGFIFLWWWTGCRQQPVDEVAHRDSIITIIIDSTTHSAESHITYSKLDTVALYAFLKKYMTKEDSSANRSEVVADYFTPSPFTDSLTNDTFDATYSGTIFKQEMFDPVFKLKLKIPITTIVNTTAKPAELRNKVYAGGFIALQGTVPAVGGSVSFQNKKEKIFTLMYGTGPTYLVGLQWKLSLKKQGKPP